MTTMFQSESAIERATGMTADEWLTFNGYGEREATNRTLRNLTQLERPEREKMEREANLPTYAERVERGQDIFTGEPLNDAEFVKFLLTPHDDSEICEDIV